MNGLTERQKERAYRDANKLVKDWRIDCRKTGRTIDRERAMRIAKQDAKYTYPEPSQKYTEHAAIVFRVMYREFLGIERYAAGMQHDLTHWIAEVTT